MQSLLYKKNINDLLLKIGISIVLAIILLNHILFLFSPFLMSFDVFVFENSVQSDFLYPFVDKVAELSVSLSNIYYFPLIYFAVVIIQLSLFLIPPLILFKPFFNLKTFIYLILCLTSWKAFTYSFSYGIAMAYLLPVVLSMIFYFLLNKLIIYWQFKSNNLYSSKAILLMLLMMILLMFGIYLTPRFLVTIIASAIWTIIYYCDSNVQKINRKKVIIFLLIILSLILILLLYGFKFEKFESIINKYLTYSPFAFFKLLTYYSRWIFIGVGPFLPIILFIPYLQRYINRNKLFFISFLLLILYFLLLIFIESVDYYIFDRVASISYCLQLFIIIYISTKKINRNGPVGFLFLNFICLFGMHLLLLMNSRTRESSSTPYIFMILAILLVTNIDKIKLAIKEVKLNYRKTVNILIVIMIIATSIKFLFEIINVQKAFSLNRKCSKFTIWNILPY